MKIKLLATTLSFSLIACSEGHPKISEPKQRGSMVETKIDIPLPTEPPLQIPISLAKKGIVLESQFYISTKSDTGYTFTLNYIFKRNSQVDRAWVKNTFKNVNIPLIIEIDKLENNKWVKYIVIDSNKQNYVSTSSTYITKTIDRGLIGNDYHHLDRGTYRFRLINRFDHSNMAKQPVQLFFGQTYHK